MRCPRRPGPKAIDPVSGFEVPWSELVRNRDGDMVARFSADPVHPRDHIKVRPERGGLPYARPEPPEASISVAIMWEDGATPIYVEAGTGPIFTEGVVPSL